MKQSNDVIFTTVSSLLSGGTLLYPTDTIWGLGCDATNAIAVEKIYALTQRDLSKSMLILCSDIAMVEVFVCKVTDPVRDLLLASDTPTTVILPDERHQLAQNLLAADTTVGVRIPRMAFCQQLLRALGRPLVSTSANLSGQPSPLSFSDISPLLIQSVDCCVPAEQEQHSSGRASRIVKLMPDSTLKVLRG